jgi:CRISPR/Cas system-associated exonuclease Cas4 (RecB family)
MMKSFLTISAEHIFNNHTVEDLKNKCIVLPSRRAAYFFKRELASLSDVPFFAPTIFSVDDFVSYLSGFKILDNVSLLFELFEVYKSFDSEIVFEKFIKWAPTVLKDFDTIDQSMVNNPHELFNYISEVEAIKRWELENQEEVEFSETITNYFDFFAQLSKVYALLYKKLSLDGNAYRGMSYRLVATEIENLINENNEFNFFYFIGLNALSKSEEIIISGLVKSKMAKCLWDSDSYYMNSFHKAGKVLNSYKKTKLFGDWNWENDFLKTTPKNINIYNLENNLTQTKLIGDLIEKDKSLLKNSVIVILDEGLISPLLYSLPNEVKDFNITMGLPIKTSMIASLVMNLFELQENKILKTSSNGFYFNHKSIIKILSNPFIKLISEGNIQEKEAIESLWKYINSNNKAYISQAELGMHGISSELIDVFMTDWENSSMQCLKYLQNVLSYFQNAFKNGLHSFEIEFFYILNGVLNRLTSIVDSNNKITITGVKLLLNELFKEQRVPFTGEPIAELQIMSMLETRCLDFDNVFIMSMNEGTLPNSQKNKSLIPFDACKIFELPIYSDQDNVMFYHFYRLLQRSKNIHLSYLSSSGGGVGVKEKSRFILQIENELKKANSNIVINYPIIEYNSKTLEQITQIEIKKDVPKIKEFLSVKGLSPSSINQYFLCPLQFYWNKIEKIISPNEIEENFKANVFGTLIHKVLENLDKQYVGQNIAYNLKSIENSVENLESELNFILETEFKNFEVNVGINALSVEIAKRLAKDFFEFQTKTFDFPINILSVEKEFKVLFEYFDTDSGNFPVKISGKVDRIELNKNTLRVVDYKTGKVEVSVLKSIKDQDIINTYLSPDKDKFRQLKLYLYFILKNQDQTEFNSRFIIENGLRLNANIYSLRDLNDKCTFESILPIYEHHENLIKEVEEFLNIMIAEMVNEEIKIKQTKDLTVCRNCDYKKLCSRA